MLSTGNNLEQHAKQKSAPPPNMSMEEWIVPISKRRGYIESTSGGASDAIHKIKTSNLVTLVLPELVNLHPLPLLIHIPT